MPTEKALVIIPTLNEIENISLIVEAVLAQGTPYHVLVVDNHSPDGTAAAVKKLSAGYPTRVFLLEREERAGLAAAYIDGFRWALAREYEYIFEMDADLSHDPCDLPRFIEAAETADLVIGSRYGDNRVSVVNWKWKRLLLSYGANLVTRHLTGLAVFDATGGFKCFRRCALAMLDLDAIVSKGYGFQIETTHYLWRRGIRIVEIPIVFTERKHGTSKMSGEIVSEALALLVRLRLRSLFSK